MNDPYWIHSFAASCLFSLILFWKVKFWNKYYNNYIFLIFLVQTTIHFDNDIFTKLQQFQLLWWVLGFLSFDIHLAYSLGGFRFLEKLKARQISCKHCWTFLLDLVYWLNAVTQLNRNGKIQEYHQTNIKKRFSQSW